MSIKNHVVQSLTETLDILRTHTYIEGRMQGTKNNLNLPYQLSSMPVNVKNKNRQQRAD